MGLFNNRKHHRHSGKDVILDYSMSSLEKQSVRDSKPNSASNGAPATAKMPSDDLRKSAETSSYENSARTQSQHSAPTGKKKTEDFLSDIKTVDQILGTSPVVTSADRTKTESTKPAAPNVTAENNKSDKPFTSPVMTEKTEKPSESNRPVAAANNRPTATKTSTASDKTNTPNIPVAKSFMPEKSVKIPQTVIPADAKPSSEKPVTAKSVTEKNTDIKPTIENPIDTKTASEKPITEKPSAPKNKHFLDTSAQAIYDRMMAERAKSSKGNETPARKTDEKAKPTPTENKSYGAKAADEIVNRVTSGISSDIGFRKTRFSETADKPTVIKTPPPTEKPREADYDDVPKIADDILFSIKREKSHFNPSMKTGSVATPKEKSENAAKIADEILSGIRHTSDDSTAYDGTKLYTNGNGADGVTSKPDPTDDAADGATRVIDFGATSDRVDPSRRSEIKHNLQRLAEEHEEEIPQGTKVKFNNYKEEELPDSDVAQPREEKPLIDDYRSVEDAPSVEADLASKTVGLTARIIVTAILTLLLFVVDFLFKDSIIASSPSAYTWINLLAFAVGIAVNFNTLRGLGGIIFNAPDMDTPAAISVTSVAVYSAIAAIASKLGELPNLIVPAMLVLLFNLFGKYLNIKRIVRGFKVIANDRPKRAITFVEDRVSSSVMANGSVIGEALICTGKKTVNVEDYLKNSYAPDPYEKKLSPVILFSLIAGAVLALAAFFTCSSLWAALAAFAMVTLAACPPATLLICNLPFYYTSKKLASYGAMLAGHSAAEKLSNANAVAFDATDLFPKDTIKLYSMKVLNKGSVDKYIAFAASVLKEANSPLANIFIDIVNSGNGEIPTSDSVKYETNMGVSGWIDDKRIFVGNRTLLEGHDISVPSLELDKKILRGGCFPVYLAIDRTLTAIFIVGYEADPEITYQLRRLCNTGITMLVTASDPNISDKMLCGYFGLYPDLIKVMNSAGDSAYKKATAFAESVSAGGSFENDISGFSAAVTAAIRMKSLTDLLMIFEIVFICLGMAITGIYALGGTLLTMPILLYSGFQLLTAVITWIITHFKKP